MSSIKLTRKVVLTTCAIVLTACGGNSTDPTSVETTSASSAQPSMTSTSLSVDQIHANTVACSLLAEEYKTVSQGLEETLTGYAPDEASRAQMLQTFINLDVKASKAAQAETFGELSKMFGRLVDLGVAVSDVLGTTQNPADFKEAIDTWKQGNELVLDGCTTTLISQ